jgi:2-keto-4-pentenoate hydratase
LTANVAQLSVEDGADMNDASRTNVINAAKALMDEHARGEKFHPLASVLQIGSIGVAYAVQHEYVRLQMQSRGAASVGYKVGLTSARMQEMCGIDSPIAGVVLADRLAGN